MDERGKGPFVLPRYGLDAGDAISFPSSAPGVRGPHVTTHDLVLTMLGSRNSREHEQ